jgi:hypothetical protein
VRLMVLRDMSAEQVLNAVALASVASDEAGADFTSLCGLSISVVATLQARIRGGDEAAATELGSLWRRTGAMPR